MRIQRAPAQRATVHPAPQVQPPGATASEEHPVQRGAEPAVTTLQRQLNVPSLGEAATAAVGTLVPAVTGAGLSAAAPAPPKLDTDELARQVYAELKRKLAVERERLRLV